MFLERGFRGGGCLGGLFCLLVEILGFLLVRYGFYVFFEMVVRR